MMRTAPHAIRLLSGRRLGFATVAAIVVAAFAPTSALAGLDDITTNLTDVDATVENVTSTVSDVTAPVTMATQTQPPAAQPPAQAISQPTAVQQVAAPVAAAVSQTAAPLTKPVANVTAPLAETTSEVAKTTAPVVNTAQSAAAPVTTPVDRVAAPLVQTVQQTAQPVVDTVQRATTPVVQTVAQATAPVLTTVAQTTAPVLATVDQVAASTVAVVSPLVQQTAQTATQVIAPVLDETAQVLDPVIRTSEQVAAPASRAVQDGPVSRGPVQEATTPTSEPGSVGGPTQQSGVVEPARVIPSASTTPTQASPVPRHGRRAATRLPDPASLFDFGDTFVAQVTEGVSSSSHQATASRTPAPAPFTPGRPFGFSLTAAAGGASFFVPLFAVVAAIFLLAAQGVGRRLRPTLAPPQLPILALSLERPG